jgi:hypothetical protein
VVGEYVNPEPDVYLVKVQRVESLQTKNGDPMWKLSLSISEGNRTGTTYQGLWFTDFWAFSKKAIPRVKGICQKMGWGGSDGVRKEDILTQEAVVQTERKGGDSQWADELKIPWSFGSVNYWPHMDQALADIEGGPKPAARGGMPVESKQGGQDEIRW